MKIFNCLNETLFLIFCVFKLIKTQNSQDPPEEGIIIDSLIEFNETIQSNISDNQTFLFNFNITNDINTPYIFSLANNKNITLKYNFFFKY